MEFALEQGEREEMLLRAQIETAKRLLSQLGVKASYTHQTVAAYSDIVASILLDIAVEAHRAGKLNLVPDPPLPLPPRTPDSDAPVGEKGQVDLFGNAHPAVAADQIECHHCGRKVMAGRYAPHLEKCMGKGRNTGRAAAKNVHMAWTAPLPRIPVQRLAAPSAAKEKTKKSGSSSKKKRTAAAPSSKPKASAVAAPPPAAAQAGGGMMDPMGSFSGLGGGGGNNLDAFDFGAALDDGFGIADDDALNLDNMDLDLDMGGGGGMGMGAPQGGGRQQQHATPPPPAVPKATRTARRSKR